MVRLGWRLPLRRSRLTSTITTSICHRNRCDFFRFFLHSTTSSQSNKKRRERTETRREKESKKKESSKEEHIGFLARSSFLLFFGNSGRAFYLYITEPNTHRIETIPIEHIFHSLSRIDVERWWTRYIQIFIHRNPKLRPCVCAVGYSIASRFDGEHLNTTFFLPKLMIIIAGTRGAHAHRMFIAWNSICVIVAC